MGTLSTSSAGQTGTAAAIVASRVPSRAPTPVAPILDQAAPLSASYGTDVKGKVGDVEGDDWDVYEA